jgi:hypothetical protein
MLFAKTGIDDSERYNEMLLLEAFETARNRETVSRSDKTLLRCSDRNALIAVNRHSRVLWGKTLCAVLERFFCDGPETADHNQPIYFVTLVDISCATDLSANVDLEGIKRRLRVGLRGLSYIGFVEPAFYTNLQAGVRFPGKRCLFWHVHALVWDVSRSQLRSLLREQRAQGKFVAIAEGFKGTDTRRIKQGDLPKVLGYLLKSPGVAYRVSRKDMQQPNGDWLLTDDGEVKARFFQRKATLRPGERIRLFHTMKNGYLDQLALAGGQGRPLLAEAKRLALSDPR